MFGEIAAGGMATVHLGRLLGPVGFSRTVAIKRLHPQYAKDPDFVSMFLDEARVAARIQHPNVVPTLDVVSLEGELFLVMDYVAGESLGRLLRALRDRGPRVPPRIVGSIMTNVLYGLHAAHEARSERGEPLGLIHRDVSPQNVLVGLDGVARVLDFGVAKAAGRVQTTGDGQVKGKLSYMPPEQIAGGEIDRRAPTSTPLRSSSGRRSPGGGCSMGRTTRRSCSARSPSPCRPRASSPGRSPRASTRSFCVAWRVAPTSGSRRPSTWPSPSRRGSASRPHARWRRSSSKSRASRCHVGP
jgi:serine/threonine protein kinase